MGSGNSRREGARFHGRGRFVFAMAVLLAAGGIFAFSTSALADEAEADGFWDAVTGGKPTLNVRGRIELARADGFERSEAYTIRTRLGYGTKPWYGVRVYTNFENVAAATKKTYYDLTDVRGSNQQTGIADPRATEINEGFLEVNRPDWLGSQLKAGRQRIVYDDARFIGDVDWRQNQQTFDGVEARSSFGLDDFSAKYGWLGFVNRIFGGGGSNPASRDFDSNSHVINASYEGIPQAKISAFAYLLDLKNSRATPDPSVNSNQTYGFRANGDFDFGEKFVLDYVASYAYQADFGDKAVDYSAHYVDAGLGVKWKGLGRIAAGWEMLGSDDSGPQPQQFLTPLATAHKFNGWADVYLNNGGTAGLRDLRLSVSPSLPWKLGGSVVYHRFWDDATGTVRGNEIDAVLKRPFGEHLVVLAKGAYFDSASTAFSEVDTWRFWMDVVIKF